jgi:hypothetical protein
LGNTAAGRALYPRVRSYRLVACRIAEKGEGNPVKLHVLGAAAAIALGSAAPTLAQQQVSPGIAIAFLDKDRDGKCNLNEYLTYQVTRIAQFDENKDGMLQYGEFKESLSGRARNNAQRTFDLFNNEEERRALTQREFLGYHAYVFKEYVDTDRDGFMSVDEWSKLMASIS